MEQIWLDGRASARRRTLQTVHSPDLEQALNQLVDDGEFHHLDGQLGRFNLFEAMGGVRSELRHSNFLAFLFSPNRAHGLAGFALQKVLRAILDDITPESRPIRPLELAVADLDDAFVQRERDNIDLLIEIPSLKLVVLIENKVGAAASDGQLQRYRAVVERRYPDYRRLLVFLTPHGITPDCEGYVAFSYRRLAEVFDELSRHEMIASEPKLLLAHYVEMLRRHVVPHEELRDLALRLYERHREAFDFVFKARPEPNGILDDLKARVLSVEGLEEDRSVANIFRFYPARWNETLAGARCSTSSWTRSGRGLLFEIKLHPSTGRVHLVLVMGPLDQPLRDKIYTGAMSRPDLFKGLVKPMGRHHSTLFNRELLTASLAPTLDFELQSLTASLAWSDFQGTELSPLIETVEHIAAKALADEN
ncbi:PD-(D/E)XK nuclease family protein [Sphingopyxis lindanitolerans]|uniref:PDDEXK-like family protein n=1 Tax=Sphingopyxis lindanitolerans TaxID=2054227 RepID=UPI0013050086|nr:PD-(D/E)XK nuclease family protein [Sphingopyxis lindanitolerans]